MGRLEEKLRQLGLMDQPQPQQHHHKAQQHHPRGPAHGQAPRVKAEQPMGKQGHAPVQAMPAMRPSKHAASKQQQGKTRKPAGLSSGLSDQGAPSSPSPLTPCTPVTPAASAGARSAGGFGGPPRASSSGSSCACSPGEQSRPEQGGSTMGGLHLPPPAVPAAPQPPAPARAGWAAVVSGQGQQPALAAAACTGAAWGQAPASTPLVAPQAPHACEPAVAEDASQPRDVAHTPASADQPSVQLQQPGASCPVQSSPGAAGDADLYSKLACASACAAESNCSSCFKFGLNLSGSDATDSPALQALMADASRQQLLALRQQAHLVGSFSPVQGPYPHSSLGPAASPLALGGQAGDAGLAGPDPLCLDSPLLHEAMRGGLGLGMACQPAGVAALCGPSYAAPPSQPAGFAPASCPGQPSPLQLQLARQAAAAAQHQQQQEMQRLALAVQHQQQQYAAAAAAQLAGGYLPAGYTVGRPNTDDRLGAWCGGHVDAGLLGSSAPGAGSVWAPPPGSRSLGLGLASGGSIW